MKLDILVGEIQKRHINESYHESFKTT